MPVGQVVNQPARARVKTFISANPIVAGITAADMYWILEGLTGVFMVYASVKGIAGVDKWFGGHADLVGVFMALAAFFRVLDVVEEEVNIIMSALLIFMAGVAGGLSQQQVVDAAKDTASSMTPEFSFNANIASVGGATNCEWWNKRQNRKLSGDPANPSTEAGWCASAVSSKAKGYQDCECK